MMDNIRFSEIARSPSIGTDGKFRIKRCKVVGEKDLKELGLETDTETES